MSDITHTHIDTHDDDDDDGDDDQMMEEKKKKQREKARKWRYQSPKQNKWRAVVTVLAVVLTWGTPEPSVEVFTAGDVLHGFGHVQRVRPTYELAARQRAVGEAGVDLSPLVPAR